MRCNRWRQASERSALSCTWRPGGVVRGLPCQVAGSFRTGRVSAAEPVVVRLCQAFSLPCYVGVPRLYHDPYVQDRFRAAPNLPTHCTLRGSGGAKSRAASALASQRRAAPSQRSQVHAQTTAESYVGEEHSVAPGRAWGWHVRRTLKFCMLQCLQRASHTMGKGYSIRWHWHRRRAMLVRASENVEDQVLSVEGSMFACSRALS
jgi:hypothetical protein